MIYSRTSIKWTACLSVLAAIIANPVPARADTATLTVTGKILPGTCKLTIAPVTLKPLKAGDVKGGDLGMADGALKFDDCVGVTKAKLIFTGAAEDADYWKNEAPTGATGISLVLKDGQKFDTLLKPNDARTLDVATATASHPFRVGYHHVDKAPFTAGDVNANITVTATYE